MRAVSADRTRRIRIPGHDDLSLPNTPKSNANSHSFPDRYGPNLSPKSQESGNSEMLDIKLTRRKAESELQQLANRVALLKMEEAKAADKVSETRSRAAEIVAIKKRNEDKLHEKILQSQVREQTVRALQAKAAAEREERTRRLSATRKMLLDSRKAVAEQKKEESRKLEDMVSQGKAYSELEKRMRAEEGRKRSDSMRQQREAERQQRELDNMREYARKLEEENERKRQAEEMIGLLESQEQELLDRLRRSQAQQAEAYSVLQRSLRA